MTINIKELLEDYVDKHGELEVDGEYGEQCKPGAFWRSYLKRYILSRSQVENGKIANERWMM